MWLTWLNALQGVEEADQQVHQHGQVKGHVAPHRHVSGAPVQHGLGWKEKSQCDKTNPYKHLQHTFEQSSSYLCISHRKINLFQLGELELHCLIIINIVDINNIIVKEEFIFIKIYVLVFTFKIRISKISKIILYLKYLNGSNPFQILHQDNLWFGQKCTNTGIQTLTNIYILKSF